MVFLQNLINALQWGSFYALIALGYSMVYSILMLFNFAHGDIFMVGAYIGFGVASALIALTAMGAFALPSWLILVLTIIFTMFLTSFVGMIVERVGYRPLRDAPRASAAITGLMIGIILETGNLALMGAQRVSFPSIIQTTTYNLGLLLLHAGRPRESIPYFETVVGRQPDDVEAWINLGVALDAMGQANAALTAFDRARTVNPYRHEPSFNSVRIHLSRGETRPARELLQSFLQRDATSQYGRLAERLLKEIPPP